MEHQGVHTSYQIIREQSRGSCCSISYPHARAYWKRVELGSKFDWWLLNVRASPTLNNKKLIFSYKPIESMRDNGQLEWKIE